MKSDQISEFLLRNRDEAYRQMQIRLIPNVSANTIIGVRTPVLRSAAREIVDPEVFLAVLPHGFFEENQLHAFLLERGKDFQTTVAQVEAFLPYIDNWATCDQLRPRCFQKHHRELLSYIQKWITAKAPYTVRFGIGMLMVHFLGQDFDKRYLEMVSSVQSEEYYVKMMISWYFATALAKQYDSAFPYISGYKLEKWVHNKAIQKSVESYRVSPEHKQELIRYRIK